MQTKVVVLRSGEQRTVEVGTNGVGQKCAAKLRNGSGDMCPNWSVKGAHLCPSHIGRTDLAAAAVRAELAEWRLGAATEDPGDILLRLVTQSSQRVSLYSSLLEQCYVEESIVSLPEGVKALIGGTFSATAQGDVYQTGEQIRGLVVLEAQERDRCANFASKAIAAGLAERQVRLAERQGSAIVEAITAALDHLGVTGTARQEAQNAAADKLLALTGS